METPMNNFNNFMSQMLDQEQQYIQKIKRQKELWQLFQEVYVNWEVKDKENLTQKSLLLTAIKESIHDRH
jgi:hypothetical protein